MFQLLTTSATIDQNSKQQDKQNERSFSPPHPATPPYMSIDEGYFIKIEQQISINQQSQCVQQQKAETLQQLTRAIVMFTQQYTSCEEQVQVIPFGSYAMGTDMDDSDIDLVCLFTPMFSLEGHFYNCFPQYLQKTLAVTCLTIIDDSYIPLIKLTVNNIQFDLVFATAVYTTSLCPTPYIPQNILCLLDNEQLVIDSRSLNILNGPRNSLLLTDLLGMRVDVYRRIMKVIKHWAVSQQIYSHVHGYLGGIQCSVMCAQVCLANPQLECPFGLLHLFFKVYSQWNLANSIQLVGESGNDQQGQLVIYAPADSSYNIAQSVTSTSVRVIKKAFRRASLQLNNIKQRRSGVGQLCKPFEFMKEYSIYMKIQINYAMNSAQTGHIGSRLKRLTSLLEEESVQTRLSPIPIQDSSQNTYYLIGLQAGDCVVNTNTCVNQWMTTNDLENVQVHLVTSGLLRGMVEKGDLRGQGCFGSDDWQEEVMRFNGIICQSSIYSSSFLTQKI